MTATTKTTISPETLKTEYLTPDDCLFYETEKGFVGATVKGVTYKRVILARAMPLTFPGEYICVSDIEKKEIGIIETLAPFSDEQKTIIEKELGQRYFSPVITEFISITEKFGHFYFDVKIGDRKKTFTIKNLSRNIRYHGEGFDLIDVDGNRYRVVDFEKIPKKSRRKIEPYLY